MSASEEPVTDLIYGLDVRPPLRETLFVALQHGAVSKRRPPGRPPPPLSRGRGVPPPLRETLFVALQHVFAVFVGMITPPLLIANALKLSGPDTAYLVSMSLFVSRAATHLPT